MNKVEKKIVETVVNNLHITRGTSWSSGDLDQWSKWAKRMQAAIDNNVPILRTLIEASDEKEDDKDFVELFNQLLWLEEEGYLDPDKTAEEIFREIVGV